MRRPDYDRRVVVTGLGVISPVGNDKDTAWANLVNGVSGLGPITKFDTTPYEAKLAGEVHDFTAADWMDPKAARRSEIAACISASPRPSRRSTDSGFELTDENRDEVGVVFGSGAGGQQLMIDNYISLHERGPRTVAPTFIANALVDSCSGMIAIETGAIGHNVCIVSACATGTHNVGEARRGDPPRRLHRGHLAARPRRRCSRSPTPASRTCAGWACPGPARRSRPSRGRSTRRATGSSSARAPASLFLEDLELAKARGAHIYAEVVGYGSAADGWDMVQPIDAGVRARRGR